MASMASSCSISTSLTKTSALRSAVDEILSFDKTSVVAIADGDFDTAFYSKRDGCLEADTWIFSELCRFAVERRMKKNIRGQK